MARKKLKDIKVSNIFNFNSVSREQEKNFFGKLIRLRKDNRIHSTWTIDGKILYKISDTSTPVMVRKEEDLQYFSVYIFFVT